MSKAIKRDHWLDYADDEYEVSVRDKMRHTVAVSLERLCEFMEDAFGCPYSALPL